jgi:periplasmic protein TorT
VRIRRGLVVVLAAAGLFVAGCAEDHVGLSPTAPPELGQNDGIVWPVRTTIWATQNTSGEPRIGEYVPLNKAEKTWVICVSVPTRQVEYYENILTGARVHAAAARVSMKSNSGPLATTSVTQAAFVRSCAANSDALVLAPVLDNNTSTAYTRLLADEKAAGKPVIIASPGLTAANITSSVSPVIRLGTADLGRWLNALADGVDGKVIILAGPKGQPQSAGLVSGLVSTFPGSNLSVAGIYYGSLQPAVQTALVAQAIREHPDAKYVVGVAGGIGPAAQLLKAGNSSDTHVLASLTYNQVIADLIKKGHVAVAIDDRAVAQGAMGVDLAIRVLQGAHPAAVIAPAAQLIDSTSITYLDQTGSLNRALFASGS